MNIFGGNGAVIRGLALNGLSLIDIGSLAHAVATFYGVPRPPHFVTLMFVIHLGSDWPSLWRRAAVTVRSTFARRHRRPRGLVSGAVSGSVDSETSGRAASHREYVEPDNCCWCRR